MKKKTCAHRYCFWRWLILTILRKPKLYMLAWGILLALLAVALKLELANQLAGVVRYPNGWTYDAGRSPFCGGGCGCFNG